MSVMDRRSFFKIVATTGAAAAAGGCGPSAEQFIPYVIPPDNIVPGIPAYFSTVCRECPSGCGLIAKNRDGGGTGHEGAALHPRSERLRALVDTGVASGAAHASFDAEHLRRLESELARHIGPVAKLLVKRAAAAGKDRSFSRRRHGVTPV